MNVYYVRDNGVGFNPEYRNLSFFLQHYVVIFTALLLVAVIFVAVTIRIRTRKSIKLLKYLFRVSSS